MLFSAVTRSHVTPGKRSICKLCVIYVVYLLKTVIRHMGSQFLKPCFFDPRFLKDLVITQMKANIKVWQMCLQIERETEV